MRRKAGWPGARSRKARGKVHSMAAARTGAQTAPCGAESRAPAAAYFYWYALSSEIRAHAAEQAGKKVLAYACVSSIPSWYALAS